MPLTFQELPLSANPVSFGIALSGVRYELTFVYRNTDVCGGCGWTLDIADTFGNPLLCGAPLVCGEDMLGQYRYLGMNGGLMVGTDGPDDIWGSPPPTFFNLGTGSHVFWVSGTVP